MSDQKTTKVATKSVSSTKAAKSADKQKQEELVKKVVAEAAKKQPQKELATKKDVKAIEKELFAPSKKEKEKTKGEGKRGKVLKGVAIASAVAVGVSAAVVVPVVILKQNQDFYLQIQTNHEGATVEPIKVKPGTTAKQLPDIVVDGYKFRGYFSDEACTTPLAENYEITKESTIYAKFARIYKLSINVKGSVQDVEYYDDHTVGETIQSAITVDKQHFVGWYLNAECTEPLVENAYLTEDTSVFAKYANMNNVTLVLNGKEVVISAYTDETLQQALQNAKVDTTGIKGWKDAKGNTVQLGSYITSAQTLYAEYENTKQVTVVINGKQTVVTALPGQTISDVLKLVDYETENLVGWYTDAEYKNKVTNLSTKITEDMHLYARYAEHDTLTLVVPGEDSVKIEIYDDETLDQVLLREGYKTEEDKNANFVGWYTDAEYKNKVTDFEIKITEDTSLYARYAEEYVLTLVLPSGEDDITVYNDETLGHVLAREGYKTEADEAINFVGWYTDAEKTNKLTDFSTAFSENVTIYQRVSQKLTIEVYRPGNVTSDVYSVYADENYSVETLLQAKEIEYNKVFTNSEYTDELTQEQLANLVENGAEYYISVCIAVTVNGTSYSTKYYSHQTIQDLVNGEYQSEDSDRKQGAIVYTDEDRTNALDDKTTRIGNGESYFISLPVTITVNGTTVTGYYTHNTVQDYLTAQNITNVKVFTNQDYTSDSEVALSNVLENNATYYTSAQITFTFNGEQVTTYYEHNTVQDYTTAQGWQDVSVEYGPQGSATQVDLLQKLVNGGEYFAYVTVNLTNSNGSVNESSPVMAGKTLGTKFDWSHIYTTYGDPGDPTIYMEINGGDRQDYDGNYVVTQQLDIVLYSYRHINYTTILVVNGNEYEHTTSFSNFENLAYIERFVQDKYPSVSGVEGIYVDQECETVYPFQGPIPSRLYIKTRITFTFNSEWCTNEERTVEEGTTIGSYFVRGEDYVDTAAPGTYSHLTIYDFNDKKLYDGEIDLNKKISIDVKKISIITKEQTQDITLHINSQEYTYTWYMASDLLKNSLVGYIAGGLVADIQGEDQVKFYTDSNYTNELTNEVLSNAGDEFAYSKLYVKVQFTEDIILVIAGQEYTFTRNYVDKFNEEALNTYVEAKISRYEDVAGYYRDAVFSQEQKVEIPGFDSGFSDLGKLYVKTKQATVTFTIKDRNTNESEEKTVALYEGITIVESIPGGLSEDYYSWYEIKDSSGNSVDPHSEPIDGKTYTYCGWVAVDAYLNGDNVGMINSSGFIESGSTVEDLIGVSQYLSESEIIQSGNYKVYADANYTREVNITERVDTNIGIYYFVEIFTVTLEGTPPYEAKAGKTLVQNGIDTSNFFNDGYYNNSVTINGTSRSGTKEELVNYLNNYVVSENLTIAISSVAQTETITINYGSGTTTVERDLNISLLQVLASFSSDKTSGLYANELMTTAVEDVESGESRYTKIYTRKATPASFTYYQNPMSTGAAYSRYDVFSFTELADGSGYSVAVDLNLSEIIGGFTADKFPMANVNGHEMTWDEYLDDILGIFGASTNYYYDEVEGVHYTTIKNVNLVIPETYNGKPVKQISSYYVSSEFDLSSVVIPKYINIDDMSLLNEIINKNNGTYERNDHYFVGGRKMILDVEGTYMDADYQEQEYSYRLESPVGTRFVAHDDADSANATISLAYLGNQILLIRQALGYSSMTITSTNLISFNCPNL